MAKRPLPERFPTDTAPPGRSGVTLGALFAKAGLAPTPPTPPTRPSAPEAPAARPARERNDPSEAGTGRALSDVGRLVVRRERKGHAGHTATVIEGLAEVGVDLDAVARQMKRVLGCGASADGGKLVLLGDVADRAAAWLEGQGVKRVIRGN